MTLNPLEKIQRLLFKNVSPPGAPPFISLCLRSLSLCLSLSLPLVFFQLRGADSLDTIIQLYCGTATVAAALCKGFKRMVRGQSGASCHDSGTEKHCHKQRGWSLVATAPHCATWQLWIKLLSPYTLVSFIAGAGKRGKPLYLWFYLQKETKETSSLPTVSWSKVCMCKNVYDSDLTVKLCSKQAKVQ